MPNPQLALSGLMMLLVPGVMPDAPSAPAWTDAAEPMQQHVTIHVPRVTITSTTIILRRTEAPAFVEKKAKDCVKVEDISGFMVNEATSVDLVLRDGKLLRAKLASNCPALGFYSGFYVKPSEDKKICAKRDYFRSRSGKSCGIDAFAHLVAER